MKKALIAAFAAIAIATMSLAIDINTATWTGAGDGVSWTDEQNWWKEATDGWKGAQAPYTANAVVVDGDNGTFTGNPKTVVYSGALTLPVSVTLLNGAILNVGTADPAYALNITSEGGDARTLTGGGDARTLTGGTVVCNYVEIQSTSKLTISDAHLKTTTDRLGRVGIYQNGGAYINIVDGENKSAQFSYRTSGVASPYQTFFSGENPVMRYNDSALDEATFSTLFQTVNNSDGTTTLSFKVQEGWDVGTVAVNSVADGQAAVSFTVTKYSGGTATVSIGCATSDLGDDIDSWVGSLTQLATGVSATTSYNETVPLENGVNYIRVFVTYDDKTTASFAAVARSIAYGDYGDLTNVYEFIGDDNNLSKATNWALDKVPLVSGDTAPTAGTHIRWFGSNTVFALSGNFHLYATDHFVGATITQANAANHDSNLNGDITFENSSVTLSTVVVQSDPHVISLKNSSFATTRAPDGVAGFYGTVPVGGVNFISGFPSSFSFGADAGDVHDAATVKSQLIDKGKITLDGAPITAETWTQFFSVDVVGTTVTVSYSPTVAENRIDGVSTTSTSTSATLTATIGAQEDGTIVKFAYGMTAPTDAEVLAGSAMTVTDGTATGAATGLTDLTVYHFVVAIVDAESTEILASKAGQFVASDFDYVYMNGAWAGEVPALNASSEVLFLDSYSTANGDVNVGNKTVIGTSLRTGTLTGHGPLVARSAQISNTRNNDLNGAPYGTWNVTAPLLDFNSLSANGTIRAACSYTFYTKRSDEDIYGEFFINKALLNVNGAAASQGDFSIEVLGTYNEGEENEYRRVSIVWFEPFPASARDADWTVQPGARVKLTKNTRIGSLDIPDASDVKIDLNGYELKVSSLTIEGEKKKGEFTAETLPAILIGEGKLVVGGSGLAIFVR